MKTAVISARASLADAGKQGRHAHKHSDVIFPWVGKTKEAGFTSWIIISHATLTEKTQEKHSASTGKQMSEF